MKQRIVLPQGRYLVKCFDVHGTLKWLEEFENLVVNQGRTDILEKYFRGSAYTAAWFMGFKNALGGQAAGDTLASHVGWTEVNPQGANRVQLTFNAAASNSITTGQFNVPITLAGPTDVGGAFVCSSQTGTSGVLYSVGDFSQLRSVISGDMLQVSQTFNA